MGCIVKTEELTGKRKFRPEIEGLRAVAALLVAVYHIWVGKVSGGVDVFFVVSGFLITISLLTQAERIGRVDFFSFILRLMKRLFPMAFLVLFVSTLGSMLLVPRVQWEQTIQEVFASIFYYQNWQLAVSSVDYLGQNNEASPFQHFWAMSIQGQFYMLWPLLIMLSIVFSTCIFKTSLRMAFLYIVSVLFVLSFSYSIIRTATDQPWAYFDTFARVWEFCLGGLLALFIAKVVLHKALALVIGWLGLVTIVFTGALLNVSTQFPGYVALLPALSAGLIMIAGNQGGKAGVHALLSWAPLTQFGSISYAFYLWHWPFLIFYYELTGTQEVSFTHGLILILGAAVVSYGTTMLFEKPIRNLKLAPKRIFSWGIMASLALPVLVAAGIWGYNVQETNQELSEVTKENEYEGAGALGSDEQSRETSEQVPEEDREILPSPVQARSDLPKGYENGCHQDIEAAEVIKCEYGETENEKFTIALVGGSHSLHWLPALEEIATEEDIKVDSYTKSACRFNEDGGRDDSCKEWNDNVISELEEDNPDMVFTPADSASNKTAGVPTGFMDQWRKLDSSGIQVFAVRDTPWFDEDIPSCVEENAGNLSECAEPRENVMAGEKPWKDVQESPENVSFYDYSDYVCEGDTCGPVAGNVLIYRDKHHLTATYAKTLGPVIRKDIMDGLKN